MKTLLIVLAVGVALAIRFSISRARRRRSAAGRDLPVEGATSTPAAVVRPRAPWGAAEERLPGTLGDTGLVALREVKERVRGRIFKISTVVMLVLVIAAVVIPTLHGPSSPTVQTVGVVGPLTGQARAVLYAAGVSSKDKVKVVVMPSLAVATRDLRTGKLDLAVVDGQRLLLWQDASAATSPADPVYVNGVAAYLGLLRAASAAGLTPAQAAVIGHVQPAPVVILHTSSKPAPSAAAIIGLVLMFVMLSQYCTWILIGVMQEKSSRVVEVLLATVRPVQLLGGKVLGIGLVAIGQAALVVGAALVTGAFVGSKLLHGAQTGVLLCELLWLVLGYAFYCWLYAAAGSTAERQDQAQTLALPLSIPILIGYVFSLTVVSTGSPDLLFKILAYVPLTAPFCMTVLVSLDVVTWWQFLASVVITILATWGMAVVATRIYRQAILQTRGRSSFRQLVLPTRR